MYMFESIVFVQVFFNPSFAQNALTKAISLTRIFVYVKFPIPS